MICPNKYGKSQDESEIPDEFTGHACCAADPHPFMTSSASLTRPIACSRCVSKPAVCLCASRRRAWKASATPSRSETTRGRPSARKLGSPCSIAWWQRSHSARCGPSSSTRPAFAGRSCQAMPAVSRCRHQTNSPAPILTTTALASHWCSRMTVPCRTPCEIRSGTRNARSASRHCSTIPVRLRCPLRSGAASKHR